MLVGLDGCEVRLCDPGDPCARVPVCARVSRVCPGSPRCSCAGTGSNKDGVRVVEDSDRGADDSALWGGGLRIQPLKSGCVGFSR